MMFYKSSFGLKKKREKRKEIWRRPHPRECELTFYFSTAHIHYLPLALLLWKVAVHLSTSCHRHVVPVFNSCPWDPLLFPNAGRGSFDCFLPPASSLRKPRLGAATDIVMETLCWVQTHTCSVWN